MQKDFTINDHIFTLTDTVPYTRIDGTKTFLRCWSTACAHPGCEVVRTFKTAAGDAPKDDFQPNLLSAKQFTRAKCKTHHVRKKQDRKLSGYLGGKASARVGDADIAELRRFASEGVTPVALSFWYPLSVGTIKEIIAGRRRVPTNRPPQ